MDGMQFPKEAVLVAEVGTMSLLRWGSAAAQVGTAKAPVMRCALAPPERLNCVGKKPGRILCQVGTAPRAGIKIKRDSTI
jgi:hypothetical protein